MTELSNSRLRKRSSQTLEKTKKIFNFFDKDNDGTISVNEIGDAIQKSAGVSLDDEQLSKIMDEYDKNGDGTIDFEEFVDMTKTAKTGVLSFEFGGKVFTMFNELDFSENLISDEKLMTDNLTNLNDVHLLYRIKKQILKGIENVLINNNKLNDLIKQELNKIWINEYNELKMRLKTNSIQKSTVKTKASFVEGLKSISKSNDVASFVLQTYTNNTQTAKLAKNDSYKLKEETKSDENQTLIEDVLKTPENVNKLLKTPNSTFLKCVAGIGTWDFNVFDLNEIESIKNNVLTITTIYCMKLFNLDSNTMLNNKYKLISSNTQFLNFLKNIELGYINNPYHNRFHGADITNDIAFMLKSKLLNNQTSLFDKFICLISAACHDVGHNGVNNTYHINTSSDLAITYNDSSVLENYHVSKTFKILKKNDCNFLSHLSNELKTYFRKNMIHMILATDMSKHSGEVTHLNEFIVNIKSELNSNSNNNSTIENIGLKITKSEYLKKTSFENISDIIESNIKYIIVNNENETRISNISDEKLFLLGLTLHVCDISHSSKNIKINTIWAKRILEEFHKQGDKEKELGLVPSPLMDRNKSKLESGQVGFIKFVVKRMYQVYSSLIKETKVCLDNLNYNLKYWEKQVKLLNEN